jgi:hypothetical protein
MVLRYALFFFFFSRLTNSSREGKLKRGGWPRRNVAMSYLMNSGEREGRGMSEKRKEKGGVVRGRGRKGRDK